METEQTPILRPMRPGDIPQVTRLYTTYLSNSLYAALGAPFVRTILTGLVESARSVNFVAELRGEIVGFLCATEDTARQFREILRRHWPRLLLWTLLGLLRKPAALWPILQTPLYFGRTDQPGVRAELLFISIRWDHRQHALSKGLVGAALEELRRREIDSVKVTTESGYEPPKRLLRGVGFTSRRTLRFYGKAMDLFVIENLLDNPDEYLGGEA